MATFLKGDCLQLMKGLPDKSVDLFICDLPYGCLSGGGGKEKTKRKNIGSTASNKQCFGGSPGGLLGVDWDIKIDLIEFWKQVKRLAKNDHTPVIMFCNTRFGTELITSQPTWFRYDLVWSKTNGVGFLSANKQPLRSHENIYVFAKKGANYKRVDIKGDFPAGGGGRSNSSVYPSSNDIPNLNTTKEGIRCVKSVIEVANKKSRGGHPTAKPTELYKWLIERYSKEGDTILDPTAGSFNSCFAAIEMKRRAIGIEMNGAYFWSATNRLIQ